MAESGAYAQTLLGIIKHLIAHPYGATTLEIADAIGQHKQSTNVKLRTLRLAGWVVSDQNVEPIRGPSGQLRGAYGRQWRWRLNPEWVVSLFDSQRLMLEIVEEYRERRAS